MSYRPLLYPNRNISSERYFEFEGGSTLPLFWVILLNEKVINKIKPKLEYIEKLSEKEYKIFNEADESTPYFELEIGIEDFKRNTKKGIDYISKLYPDYLPLYKDFIEFIAPENKDDFILINIYDFFQDTDNADETTKFLLHTIEPIQQNDLYCKHHENLIFIVGYYEQRFASYSKVYNDRIIELNKLEAQRERNHKILKEQQKTLKYQIKHKFVPKIISWISIIMVVFAFTSWYFYKKDGFFEITTFAFISLTILMFYTSIKITK